MATGRQKDRWAGEKTDNQTDRVAGKETGRR